MNEFSNAEMADMHCVYGVLMEMDEPRHGCTSSAPQADVSQVTFCLDNCTAGCLNQDLSKYVVTSVENVLHSYLSWRKQCYRSLPSTCKQIAGQENVSWV